MSSAHFCCEATLLGKAALDGPLSVNTLSQVVSRLQAEGQGKDSLEERRCTLECSDKCLCIGSSKKDEGFESDSESTKSSEGSGGKRCGVESMNSVNDHVIIHDHVMKFGDSDETSSANSSGSDTDVELESSLPPTRTTPRKGCPTEEIMAIYSIDDILFCHTDMSFPEVVVWVIRVKGGSSLEAVVFDCNNEESAKELYKKFHEVSRKCKSEKYRHIRRRSDSSILINKQLGVYKQFEVGRGSEGTASNTVQCSVVSAVCNTSDHVAQGTVTSDAVKQGSERHVRWNLLQHTDRNGVTHIEVESSEPCSVTSLCSEDTECSSIISINTPDVGDVVIRSGAGTRTPQSKVSKQIQGLISAEVGSWRERPSRQRQPALLLKQWRQEERRRQTEEDEWKQRAGDDIKQQKEEDDRNRRIWARRSIERRDKATERPVRGRSRGRYIHNKGPAPDPPPRRHPTNPNLLLVPTKSGTEERSSSYPKESHVVRGRFIRVSVGSHEQPRPPIQSQSSSSPLGWHYTDLSDHNNNTNRASQSHHVEWRSAAEIHHVGRDREPPITPEPKRRSRSKSPARRSMAWRHVDTVSSPKLSGISQKFKEISDAVLSKKTKHILSERTNDRVASRSSMTNIPNENFGNGILKSRKKSKENCDRRVTFSAYSTVQMID